MAAGLVDEDDVFGIDRGLDLPEEGLPCRRSVSVGLSQGSIEFYVGLALSGGAPGSTGLGLLVGAGWAP
jgi:hypothetical protein